jgi:hypothetical protein
MLRVALVLIVLGGGIIAAPGGISASSPARSEPPPGDAPLVMLSATGEVRDGLPVVIPHPEPARYLSALIRGYSGRLLRLYRLAQHFAHPDRTPQPAYLALTGNQGGFPRFGFHDESPRPGIAYVDLHRGSQISGRAGAMDQIFPHELLHIIVRDLAGPMPRSRATQVHAVGVRTDRVTAFNEGFAIHGQLMAIDDVDGLAETRAIASDGALRDRAFEQFADYRRAVSARWSVAPKARMTFPLWFSGAEQVLRYHAVRDNLFSREPDVPVQSYGRDAYRAYLLENTLPGQPAAPARSLGRLLATEGVVAAFVYRLVNAPAIRGADRDDAFYRRFGTTRGDIDDLENAYLKLFAAIRDGGYDIAAVAAAYGRLFPEEQVVLEAIWGEIFHGPAEPPVEIWLMNRDVTTGTSLFDQFRGRPRPHAFDLNASSKADLAAVPGVSETLASTLLASVPFEGPDDLARVRGITPEILASFRRMEATMHDPQASGVDAEGGLSLRGILMPYLWRALAVWFGCAVAGALGYRALRKARVRRLVVVGGVAALAGLMAGWTLEPGGLAAIVVPLLLFGLPASTVALWRSRSPAHAARVVAGWLCAALPAALAVTPLG